MLHLTLAFLGEVEAKRWPLAAKAAAGVVSEAFDLCFDRLAYWQHNHILWAGCSREHGELQNLVGSLSSQLRAQDFELERRHFSPHMTLVRKMMEKPAAPLLLAPTTWTCREFVLMESVPVGRGVDYKKLASWRLAS